MFILGQNENKVVTTDNIVSINIRFYDGFRPSYSIVSNYSKDDHIIIGSYLTEKRATEVLKEIFEAAGRLQKSYIMPKE